MKYAIYDSIHAIHRIVHVICIDAFEAAAAEAFHLFPLSSSECRSYHSSSSIFISVRSMLRARLLWRPPILCMRERSCHSQPMCIRMHEWTYMVLASTYIGNKMLMVQRLPVMRHEWTPSISIPWSLSTHTQTHAQMENPIGSRSLRKPNPNAPDIQCATDFSFQYVALWQAVLCVCVYDVHWNCTSVRAYVFNSPVSCNSFHCSVVLLCWISFRIVSVEALSFRAAPIR